MAFFRIVVLFSLLHGCLLAGAEKSGWSESVAEQFFSINKSRALPEIEDYSISSNIDGTRKDWLLERMTVARDFYSQGRFEYSIVDSEESNNMAVAVVSVSSKNDPFFKKLFAQGFCKVNDEWKAAPLVGSFDYTGVGNYNESQRVVRKQLEEWAKNTIGKYTRKQSQSKEDLYKARLADFRNSEEALLGADRSAVLKFFIEACRTNNVMAALACVDNGEMPRSLRQLIVGGFNQKVPKGLWDVFINKTYLYDVLPQVEDRSIVSLGMYFPYEKRHNQQIVEFEFVERKGQWFLEVPYSLETDHEGRYRDYYFRLSNLHSDNQSRVLDVRNMLFAQITEEFSETPEGVLAKFEKVIGEGDVIGFLELVPPSQRGLDSTISVWKRMTKSSVKNVRRVYEELYEDAAYVMYLMENWPRLELFFTSAIQVIRTEKGWTLDCSQGFRSDLDTLMRNGQSEKYAEFSSTKEERILNLLLPESAPMLDNLLPIDDSSKSAAEVVYHSYVSSLESSELNKLSERLVIPSGGEKVTLKAIGSDARGRMGKGYTFEWVKAVQTDKLVMGIVSFKYFEHEAVEYLCYPFLRCDAGMRISPSLMYYYEHGRGQVIQNRQTQKFVKAHCRKLFLEEYSDAIELANLEIEGMLKQDKQ